ncbi:MarR family winged helix-turn-helix transcriptional regulator [Streptomyces odontomachi]|uniref:MarR family winged helix-turn-helix transcriptional regulator n=1 Tax=Streptomyces odontomachi TaxID=2944940 RepID=UPI00210EC259|nr:MarR family winged helix-turn-helix transcriptional regulator [Streptomyces sp. ODS25]
MSGHQTTGRATDDGERPATSRSHPVGRRAARDAAVETIHRELTVFARRARATAGRMHPQLSLVAYTLLSHLEERGGCRATDLAAHYALDKSTVSRQVAALERDGLVHRRVDPEDHRGQVLDLTPEGTGILAEVTESRRAAFESRLAGWPPADLLRFADFLRRYNEAASRPDDDPTAPAAPPGPPPEAA